MREHLQVEHSEGVVTVWIDRQEKLNPPCQDE
jgi:hypothetical protein